MPEERFSRERIPSPTEELMRTARLRRLEAPEVAPEAESQVIVFRLAGRELALPIETVERTERMPAVTPVPRCPAFLRGVASLRGGVVAVVDLDQLLGHTAPSNPARSLLVLAREGRRLGIMSESLPDFVRVRASQRMPAPSSQPDLYSCVIERHFEPVGIIDPQKLFELVERRLSSERSALEAPLPGQGL